MDLTSKQKLGLSMVEAGHNLYIGGQAGCGKSFLITKIIESAEARGKLVALTCTTGVACSNYPTSLKPMTIHKWSGIGDGRLSGGQVRQMMLSLEDRLLPAKERIMSTDLLIIDEISMLSKRMFEILEGVLRIRDNRCAYGGIQIVLVGDFLQLPPVRNLRYDDLGEFVFLSQYWPNHSIYLSEIFRQSDRGLINMVKELSVGMISDETLTLINRLNRKLPENTKGQDTVKLFATNILVDLFNRDKIMELDGPMYSFAATDSGDGRALDTLVVPSTLWLKVGCRVMLLKNLSNKLVNGLQGHVRDVKESYICVYFPKIQELANIHRQTFTVFDPPSQRNICERNQFPLKLCYGITIHKSQGMSLDRVEVDCRHIFQPGQLGVGIGRARSVEGLRITNFSENAVKPQPKIVTDFIAQEGLPFQDDCSCCHIVVDQSDVELPEQTFDKPETVINPDIIDFEDDMDDPEFNQLLADIGQGAEEQTGATIPDSLDIKEKLNGLSYKCPVTEEQYSVNSVITSFSENEHIVKSFMNQQYQHCLSFFAQTVISEPGKESPVPQSQLTAFYQMWQAHMTSKEYESECLPLILVCSNATKSAMYSVTFKLSTVVRQLLLSDKAAPLAFIDTNKVASRMTEGLDATARGKIRYIGGYAVAKIKYHYSKQIKSNMYSTSASGISKLNSAIKITDYLEKMEISENLLIETTTDRDSLAETSRKQNINRGLTNISDKSYQFFQSIVNASLNELNSQNLVKHGNSMHEFVMKTVQEKEGLFESFCEVCIGENSSSDDDIIILFKECIYKISSILFKQFTKDLMETCNVKKKMEHRKQIQVSSKKTNVKKTTTKTTNPISEEQPGTSGLAKVKKTTKKTTNPISEEQPGTSGLAKVKKTTKKTTNPISEEQPGTSGLGKGAPSSKKSVKKTSSRKRTKTDDEQSDFDNIDDHDYYDDDDSCFKCGKLEKDNEDWIACDVCNKWYHRGCCGLSSVKRWNYYTKQKNRKFCCPQCE